MAEIRAGFLPSAQSALQNQHFRQMKVVAYTASSLSEPGRIRDASPSQTDRELHLLDAGWTIS
jgi:hypothetical protein